MLALPLAIVPAAAQTRDDCRAIRALTNADGRRFADVSLGIARAPYRVSLGIRGVEALPSPESCNLGVYTDEVVIRCTWMGGHDISAGMTYDRVFAVLNRCLTGISPSTELSYAAPAVRRSQSKIPTLDGVTEIDLQQIASAQDLVFEYVSLEIRYQVDNPD